jgi:hypothetical protein
MDAILPCCSSPIPTIKEYALLSVITLLLKSEPTSEGLQRTKLLEILLTEGLTHRDSAIQILSVQSLAHLTRVLANRLFVLQSPHFAALIKVSYTTLVPLQFHVASLIRVLSSADTLDKMPVSERYKMPIFNLLNNQITQQITTKLGQSVCDVCLVSFSAF